MNKKNLTSKEIEIINDLLDTFNGKIVEEKEDDMRPPQGESNYEQVAIGEFIFGTITDIKYETEHKFNYGQEEKIGAAIPGKAVKLNTAEGSRLSRRLPSEMTLPSRRNR